MPHPQLAHDGEHGERRQHVFDGVAAHEIARQAIDLQVERLEDLGEGIHYGEWWGQGIARKYDAQHKTFSLFNTARYADITFTTPSLDVVPVLYEGPFDETEIDNALVSLQLRGSKASPGFMNPEGVIVYHSASRQVFKVTLDSDDQGKWEAAA